jgi:cation-transporting ATPase I
VVTDDALETIVHALVEGRAIWRSVRDAIAVLVGGNVGEVGYMLGGTVVGGRPPLNARQLLLTNLLTDLLPALAISVQRPRGMSPEELLRGGPDTALGDELAVEIATRGAMTAMAASAALLVGRATGRPARARTVGLVGLVGAQLGQTVAAGARDPLVLAGSAASWLGLVAAVQTPGVNRFFGCTPLGPVGWATGMSTAAAATVAAHVAMPALRSRVAARLTAPRPDAEGSGDRAGEPPSDLPHQRGQRQEEQLRSDQGEKLFHVEPDPGGEV